MNNFKPGDMVYIVRSGMRDYINRQVAVHGPGSKPNSWDVEAVGGWTFPHGKSRADVQDAYLSQTRKRDGA